MHRAMIARRTFAAAAIIALAGCGSSGGAATPTTPTTPAVTSPVTITTTGSTRQSGINQCSGDAHTFSAAEGAISVTLTATSDSNSALSVQVCSGSSDTSANCAIKQQKIAVGQTLTGDRVGTAAQTLKFLPYACVFGSTYDPTPITYSASVTYRQ